MIRKVLISIFAWVCISTQIPRHLISAEAGKEQDRPNILFCFADDWGRYASIYGEVEKNPSVNQIVKTPNIDRIAKKGVLFRNAYVGSPSCTPCRSALLSGRYFFNTGRGAILNGARWDTAIPSWPLLLRDSGYHIGKSYKVWSPGTPADAPYGGQAHAYEKAGRLFNDFSENATKMVKEGKSFEAAKKEILAQVEGNFTAFLKDRKQGQPFCFWFGPTLTHRKWEKGSGMALWGINPESLKGKMPAFLPDAQEIREDMSDYLGEIQAWDSGIGVLIKKLEEAGELDRTLVVISGDHGMPGVPGGKCNLYDFGTAVSLMIAGPNTMPGRVVEDFVWLPDLSSTFLELAGVPIPVGCHSRSLLPVLRSNKSGQVDPERTWVLTGRERHVSTAREGNSPYPHRALRTKEWLYIRNFRPERTPMGDVFNALAPTTTGIMLMNDTRVGFADMDASPTKAWLVAERNSPQWKWYYDFAFGLRPMDELYDLRKDPGQTNNVAKNPVYSSELKKMSEQLLKILADTGDPRVVEGGKRFENPPFTDP